MTLAGLLMWAAVAVAGLLALDRLLLWMEIRGWIYWRKTKRKGSGSIAAGLIAMNAIYDPSAHHLSEARQEQEIEDEDDGDDDSSGGPVIASVDDRSE